MNGSGFSERVDALRTRMAQACERAGRGLEEVRLVAVTKKQPPERIVQAASHGVDVFGENRVQEAAAKIPQCPGGLSWHMIGHVQTNKAARAAALFDQVHSLDSPRLGAVLDAACAGVRPCLPVLLQVNVAGEASKFGIDPQQLPATLEAAASWTHLEVRGLMTMPPWSEDPEHARPHFRRLRGLLERSNESWGFPMSELSMGMSHDFEVAIEEGATWIRVGTALFGARS